MAGLRILFVFMVSALCLLDVRGIHGGNAISRQNNAGAILKKILDDAVKDDIITEAKASNLLAECTKQGLTKRTPAEILDEALQIGWTYSAVSSTDFDKITLWASEAYPDIFKPLETLSVSEIVEWFKTNVPFIESQLGQLSGDKLRAVEIAATVLHGAFGERGISKEAAIQVTEAVIKSLLEDKEDAMTALSKTIPEFVSKKVLPEKTAWMIIRAAVNADLGKKAGN